MDNRPSKAIENVDSIPVVHLEDMPPITGEGVCCIAMIVVFG